MKHTLISDLSRDITFEGEEESLVSSKRETGTGRFTVHQVWKTSGGNYACAKIYKTQWQGENDNHLAKICKTHEEVISFYGLGEQAKDLYYKLGIDCSITEEEYLAKGNPKQEYQDLCEFDE